MSATNAGPQGIGGWLLLPAIGLILSPIRLAFAIYTQATVLVTVTTQPAFTEPGSAFYHPNWAGYAFASLASSVALFAATLYLAWRFFTRSPKLPMLYIQWMLAVVALQWADIAVVKHNAFPMAGMSDAELYRDLVRAVIASAIWIPYFLYSKRVRNTFTDAPAVATAPRVEHREPAVDEW